MLFYRRKSLVRPQEAKGQRECGISQSLLNYIRHENEELQKQREEYDKAVNLVDVKILLSDNYTVKSGAIHLLHNGPTPDTISLDRRKTLWDLRLEISQLQGHSNFVLHTARETPAGIHLFDYLMEDDKTLFECGIKNGDMIFVWDGEKVGGGVVTPGGEFEPLLLTVLEAGTTHNWMEGYPKVLTLQELRLMLAETTGYICVIAVVKDNGDNVVLDTSQDSLTLDQLGLSNGSSLCVWENGCDRTYDVSTTREDVLLISVEDRCNHEVAVSHPTMLQVQATSTMTVQDLKIVIMNKLRVQDKDTHRLRIDDPQLGLRPPLHEQLTLTDAGMKKKTVVVLEPGVPPLTNQISVTVMPPGANQDNFELLIERNSEVRVLLMMAVCQAKVGGQDWHLRKTTWCGEPDLILDDADATLDSVLIKDGDLVLLEAGRIPPKGYFQLNIWLYPDIQSTGPKDNSGGLLSWVTSGLQGLLGGGDALPIDTRGQQPINLGMIEVHKDTMVDDLKLQVQKLPGMASYNIFMPDFIRLRVIEKWRLRAVLRSGKQSIQRQKVINGGHIGVEVLNNAEILSNNDMVLNIWLRDPGWPEVRNYTVYKEMILDGSHNVTPEQLRLRIANHCNIPEDRIAIAKYLTDKFEWIPIVAMVTTPQNTSPKGKKGKQNKVSVKQAPYSLKDGDIIAVKDLSHDSSNCDDFTTMEDDIGKQKIKMEAEEKKKRRKEKKAETAELGCLATDVVKRREEKSLSIKVDKFR